MKLDEVFGVEAKKRNEISDLENKYPDESADGSFNLKQAVSDFHKNNPNTNKEISDMDDNRIGDEHLFELIQKADRNELMAMYKKFKEIGNQPAQKLVLKSWREKGY